MEKGKRTTKDLQEKFDDFKGVIRRRNTKDKRCNKQKNGTKEHTMFYKALRRKLKMDTNKIQGRGTGGFRLSGRVYSEGNYCALKRHDIQLVYNI